MIKDILVHLDGSAEDENRVRHAQNLAAVDEATLVGVLTAVLPGFRVIADGLGEGAAGRYDANTRSACEAHLARLNVDHRTLAQHYACAAGMQDLIRIDGTLASLPAQMVGHARAADLVVATCPYRHGHRCWDDLIESVMLEGGRSLYLIPPGCPPKPIRSVLVAWKATRELTRAVAEAMPLLRAAEMTTIVSVAEPELTDAIRSDDLDRLAAHLRAHGARAATRILEGGSSPVAALILEEAHRLGADLIVFGAYGHSRFREWLIGGTTRELLRDSDVPLLAVH